MPKRYPEESRRNEMIVNGNASEPSSTISDERWREEINPASPSTPT